jgi:O-methyltransferase
VPSDNPSTLDKQLPSYDADFLRTWNKSVDFLTDARFVSAYHRGMDSGHAIGRPLGSDEDIHIEWRIHVCCWAAAHACRLPGDFVECGTNTGIMSLAVCEYLDFNRTGKNFYQSSFEGVFLTPCHPYKSTASVIFVLT